MKRLAEWAWFAMVCGSSAFAATISIEPPTKTVTLGNPVSLNINVAEISDLYAFQFDISFDPAVLSAMTVTEGSLFNSEGVGFSPGFVDNVGGSITFIGDSLSGPGPGLSADGALAKITFNSVGTGSTNIVLSNVVLLDSGLNDINVSVSDASVTVNGNSAGPEPGTGALLLSAIAMAAVVGAAFRPRKALLS